MFWRVNVDVDGVVLCEWEEDILYYFWIFVIGLYM